MGDRKRKIPDRKLGVFDLAKPFSIRKLYLCLIRLKPLYCKYHEDILVDSFCPFQLTLTYYCHHVHSFFLIHKEILLSW